MSSGDAVGILVRAAPVANPQEAALLIAWRRMTAAQRRELIELIDRELSRR